MKKGLSEVVEVACVTHIGMAQGAVNSKLATGDWILLEAKIVESKLESGSVIHHGVYIIGRVR